MKCKITVDEDLCLGCGACTTHDDYMEMDGETGKAKAKKASFPDVPEDLEGICPAGAITVKKEK